MTAIGRVAGDFADQYDSELDEPPAKRQRLNSRGDYRRQTSRLHDDWNLNLVDEVKRVASIEVAAVINAEEAALTPFTALHRERLLDELFSEEFEWEEFEELFMNLLLSYEKERTLPDISQALNQLARKLLTSMNARATHERAVELYSGPGKNWKGKQAQTTELVRAHFLADLGARWLKAHRLFEVVGKTYESENLPNHCFDVTTLSGRTIRYFRMASPEHHGKIDPIYRAMLKTHRAQQTCHLDVCLRRFKSDGRRVRGTRARIDEQRKFPDVLLTYAHDVYHRANWDGSSAYPGTTCAGKLKRTYLKDLLSHRRERVLLPSLVRHDEEAKEWLEKVLNEVHEDHFPTQEGLQESFTSREWADFVLFSSFRIHEEICERYPVTTVSTTCAEHIDRGALYNGLFYGYFLVKSGQISNPEQLQYLTTLVLPLAMLVRERPMHYGTIMALLSCLGRLFSDESIARVQARETFFTGATLALPPLIEEPAMEPSMAGPV